ncbi:MAG: hypothetical protein QF437_21575, partial [Planctomycetota bacterium]|nr:hypothetical protein [Planctomycetota bacterium]
MIRELNKVVIFICFQAAVFSSCTRAEDSTGKGTAADENEVVDVPGAEGAAATPLSRIGFPVASNPKPLTPLMERELRGCFDFFWNEWVSDPKSPTYGMTNGDYVGLGRYSPIPIESQGFYFAAIVVGVKRGWITREDGYKRAVITLKTLKKLKHIRGFYYHFIDPDTGRRG